MPKPQITNKPEWKEIRMNRDGEKMFQIFYVGKFTKPNIEHLAQQSSNELKRKKAKGTIQVTLIYPNGQHRAGKRTDVGDPVDIYDQEEYYDEADLEYTKEPKHFSKFYMYFLKKESKIRT